MIISISMLITGPSKILHLPQSSIFSLIGLIFLGIGCGISIVPVLSEVIEVSFSKYNEENIMKIASLCSSLFVISQLVGQYLFERFLI